jgi:4-aminobutyrate aminotransferase-like enzyme
LTINKRALIGFYLGCANHKPCYHYSKQNFIKSISELIGKAINLKILEDSEIQNPERIGKMVLDYMQMKDFMEEPLIISKADGVRYWDINGKMYYDGIAGVFAASVGYNNRRVINAIKEQLDILTFASPIHGTSISARVRIK